MPSVLSSLPIRLSPRRIAQPAVPWRRALRWKGRTDPSWHERALALWEVPPTGLAIIFVHGFAGNAVATWHRFAELWPLAMGDLVFYGYESMHRQVHYIAAELREFLEDFLAAPSTFINPTVKHMSHLYSAVTRPPDFAYERILLVAHSLGAVVARRALLDGARNQVPWLPRTRLILFAPAHKGAYLSELVFAALTGVPISAPLASLAKFMYPSIQGLEKDSKLLNDLEAETIKTLAARSALSAEPLQAAKVIIAEHDRVVIQGRFGVDPPEIPFPGCGHMDVCKPTHPGSRPLTEVAPLVN